MSGKKGRSGRLPRHVIAIRESVINLSWDFLEACLLDPKFPKRQKADIATKICVKSIPQEVEANSNIYLKVLSELDGTDPDTIRGVIARLRESVSQGRPFQLN